MEHCSCTGSDTACNHPEMLKSDAWEVQVQEGMIRQAKVKIGGELFPIPMRTDEHGMKWIWNGQAVDLARTADLTYTGTARDGAVLTLGFRLTEKGQLCIHAAAENPGPDRLPVDRGSLSLGVDTFLNQYPDYLDYLVTTLIRCEKTHLWGYFQSPSGRILTISTDTPVASYSMDYQPGIYAHHIYTVRLDLLQSGKLPRRHPAGLDHLDAGEKKEWNIFLQPVEEINRIDRIKPLIAENSGLLTLDAGRYTLGRGESTDMTLYSATAPGKAVMTAPDGTRTELSFREAGAGRWTARWTADGSEGVYTLDAANGAGYQAQAVFSVRKPYSWYMQQARKAAYDIKQGAQLWFEDGNSAECWFGILSGYIAQRYWPDEKYLKYFDQRTETVLAACYNRDLNTPFDNQIHYPERVTNHESMANMLLLRYQATGDLDSLEQGAVILDYVSTARRRADGAFAGYSFADYTSVLYPAKLTMDYAAVEEKLLRTEKLTPSQREKWENRLQHHREAARICMERLATLGGYFETEGDQTYEDGANSCSVTQLSQYALLLPEGSAQRQHFLDEAVKINNGHTSHQLAVVPDSRMNGGTLRYWETTEISLYSNVMSAPHGWSGWALYGLYNLYELTGDLRYLERASNAMGSDIQLIGYDGTLRWGFAPDPHREVELFMKDETRPLHRTADDFYYSPDDEERDYYEGKHVPYTISEEYLPHVGYWYANWTGQTPHEIFKALSEKALTRCYVHEKEDGSLEAFNCTAGRENGRIVVTPAEAIVTSASLCLKKESPVLVRFASGDLEETVAAGLPHWVETEENRPVFQVKVSDSVKNGRIELTAAQGHAGDRIGLRVIPEAGYRLAAGSLQVNGVPGDREEIRLGCEDILVSAAFAKAESGDVVGFEACEVRMEAGDVPALPKQVTALYADGTCARMDASWEELPLAKLAMGGTVQASGTAGGRAVFCRVTVLDKQCHISRIAPVQAVMTAGGKPVLPEAVAVTYDDGCLDGNNVMQQGSSALRRVNWHRVPVWGSPAELEIRGSVEGTELEALCRVRVLGAFKNPLVRFEPLALRCRVGEAPELPAEIRGYDAEGRSCMVPVTWDSVPAWAAGRRGLYVLEGQTESTPVRPQLTLIFSRL